MWRKIIPYNGDLYYKLPNITLPKEDYKYLPLPWFDHYTWSFLAYTIYGNVDMYWLLLLSSGITNPFINMSGRTYKMLLPAYISEIIYG